MRGLCNPHAVIGRVSCVSARLCVRVHEGGYLGVGQGNEELDVWRPLAFPPWCGGGECESSGGVLRNASQPKTRCRAAGLPAGASCQQQLKRMSWFPSTFGRGGGVVSRRILPGPDQERVSNTERHFVLRFCSAHEQMEQALPGEALPGEGLF